MNDDDDNNTTSSDSESDSKRARMSVTNPYLKTPPPDPVEQTLVEASASEGTTSSSAVTAPQLAQQDATAKPASVDTLPVNNEKQTFGEKDPAVQRLPSRNVSFGSAEVLTVSELHKHSTFFVDHSVRVTGTVLYRHVTSDGNVCLVLKDPSIQQQPKTAPKSILKTPGGIKRRLSGGSTSSLRLVTRKRPLSSLLKKPPLPAINPVETIVNSLTTEQQQQHTVLVYAVSKQMPVNDAAVGDLVMIIGQVKTTCPVPASMQSIVEKWNEKTRTTNTFLHARILRNVNGTDMRLHDEALRMRRQHFRSLSSAASESNHQGTGEVLRSGCGPPPYSDGTVDTREMNV